MSEGLFFYLSVGYNITLFIFDFFLILEKGGGGRQLYLLEHDPLDKNVQKFIMLDNVNFL